MKTDDMFTKTRDGGKKHPYGPSNKTPCLGKKQVCKKQVKFAKVAAAPQPLRHSSRASTPRKLFTGVVLEPKTVKTRKRRNNDDSYDETKQKDESPAPSHPLLVPPKRLPAQHPNAAFKPAPAPESPTASPVKPKAGTKLAPPTKISRPKKATPSKVQKPDHSSRAKPPAVENAAPPQEQAKDKSVKVKPSMTERTFKPTNLQRTQSKSSPPKRQSNTKGPLRGIILVGRAMFEGFADRCKKHSEECKRQMDPSRLTEQELVAYNIALERERESARQRSGQWDDPIEVDSAESDTESSSSEEFDIPSTGKPVASHTGGSESGELDATNGAEPPALSGNASIASPLAYTHSIVGNRCVASVSHPHSYLLTFRSPLCIGLHIAEFLTYTYEVTLQRLANRRPSHHGAPGQNPPYIVCCGRLCPDWALPSYEEQSSLYYPAYIQAWSSLTLKRRTSRHADSGQGVDRRFVRSRAVSPELGLWRKNVAARRSKLR